MAKKQPTAPVQTRHGQGGEPHQSGYQGLTTNHGMPISDNQNSLRAGARGPTLLEDFVLREKIFHFDHERIPERIVHARGTGAHGFFECLHPIPELTRASLFQKAGARVPVFCRFSTVAGSKGSKDTPRDVRGFAVKFYTDEGNWDLVGNNMPVFFIQDAIKFPDLIHAVKPEADRGFPQAASAHDTFWDFVSLMPESMHMVLWLMSDRALPRSFRMMEGFGVHTFQLVNEQGQAHFVKFHWKPKQGMQSTLWDEAVKISGADPDYLRRDLYEAIQSGAFPEWELGIQVFDQQWASQQDYDVLDPTKLIPEETLPVKIIGRLVLDRYPDNFFAETEQVAFLPSNVVPGIDFSDDPLLQGRLFSYMDTQKSRLGTTNFHQIPVNAPRCPFHNFQRDGMMQTQVFKGRATYEPNSLGEVGEPTGPREQEHGFRTVGSAPQDAAKLRVRAESFADHYTQARLFYRSQSEIEQEHLIAGLVFELSKVQLNHVRLRVLSHMRVIDEGLAQRAAQGLGLELPEPAVPAVPPRDMPPSAALSILAHKPPAAGRCLGILVTDGADDALVGLLRKTAEQAGVAVKIVAPRVGGVTLASGRRLPADEKIDGAPSVLFDAVALLMNESEAGKLCNCKAAVDFVSDAYGHLKALGHDGGAKPLLERAGVSTDKGVFVIKTGGDLVGKVATRFWERRHQINGTA
ncbi:catalase [Alcaligenes sp. WGS1538]|uniref:catalase n=1 Tax=Alcaligenes sp. WGS1538 TaxID=3366811 RepID=UPI00372D507E